MTPPWIMTVSQVENILVQSRCVMCCRTAVRLRHDATTRPAAPPPERLFCQQHLGSDARRTSQASR
eukprot:329303-Hanusia_phi.AAC.1